MVECGVVWRSLGWFLTFFVENSMNFRGVDEGKKYRISNKECRISKERISTVGQQEHHTITQVRSAGVIKLVRTAGRNAPCCESGEYSSPTEKQLS